MLNIKFLKKSFKPETVDNIKASYELFGLLSWEDSDRKIRVDFFKYIKYTILSQLLLTDGI